MPTYDFVCDKCNQRYEIAFRMSDDAGRAGVKCLHCETALRRIFGAPAIVVKGTINQVLGNLSANQAIINHDGQPIRLNFVDHGERSQLHERSIGNSIPGARMDEKTGKMVVDVVSNVKDPMGKIEALKRRSRKDTQVRRVNQPFKIRGK